MNGLGPIVFPFPNKGLGGSHMSTFLLAAGLLELEIPIYVATARGTKAEAEARRRGLPVFVEASAAKAGNEFLGGIGKDLRALPERVAWLKSLRGKPIVHCSDSWIVQGWGAAAKFISAPVIYHQRAFVKGRFTEKMRCKLADRIISISNVCADNFLSEIGSRFRTRLDVIVNPFLYDRSILARTSYTETPFVGNDHIIKVGFIGNFETRKRPDFFLKVAASILKYRPNTMFLIFGGNGDFTADMLVDLCHTLGIQDNVQFIGFRTPPEANFEMIDLLIAPALAEPFGRTLVESILAGTPYIATDDAGHSEICNRWGGGVLVSKYADEFEFARLAVQAIDQMEDITLDADAIAHLGAELSPRSHAQSVMEVYLKLDETRLRGQRVARV